MSISTSATDQETSLEPESEPAASTQQEGDLVCPIAVPDSNVVVASSLGERSTLHEPQSTHETYGHEQSHSSVNQPSIPSNQAILDILNSMPKTSAPAEIVPDQPDVLSSISQKPLSYASSTVLPKPNTTALPTMASTRSETDVSTKSSEYDQFLVYERRVMGSLAPGTFEAGSRMFVGNISSERTSKRVLYDIFSKYGKLAQISIKSSYGFIQYHSSAECRTALTHEQDVVVAGQSLHLEISKPQVARTQAAAHRTRSRSRSPVRRGSSTFGRPDTRHDRDAVDTNHARHQPSVPSFGYSSRQDTRSTLPPDIEIIVLDGLDTAFVQWVEAVLAQQGLSTHTSYTSIGSNFEECMRHSVRQGVLAVVICTRQLRSTNKVDLRIFDRAAQQNARFDEYRDMDVPIVASLVKQKRSTMNDHPDIAAMISKMDPAVLAAVIDQVKRS